MTDRTDERHSDGSSDSDPFEYPADASAADDSSADSPSPPGRMADPASETESDPAERERPDGVRGWFHRFRTADSGPMLYARDLVTSVAIVLAIGAVLFAVSGVWPPMVAIESGSMEPNMVEGDLVLVVDNERFVPEEAITHEGHTTGVIPADVARNRGRTDFGAHGDVIVFRPNGNTARTPVIHRTMLWVEAGENWYDRADPDAIGGADDCAELAHCPAPNAGFITQGDNEVTNQNYDQVTRLSAPVRPEWIVGTAELRIPHLGRVRLLFTTVTVEEPSAADTLEAARLTTEPPSTRERSAAARSFRTR